MINFNPQTLDMLILLSNVYKFMLVFIVKSKFRGNQVMLPGFLVTSGAVLLYLNSFKSL